MAASWSFQKNSSKLTDKWNLDTCIICIRFPASIGIHLAIDLGVAKVVVLATSDLLTIGPEFVFLT